MNVAKLQGLTSKLQRSSRSKRIKEEQRYSVALRPAGAGLQSRDQAFSVIGCLFN